MIKLRSNFLIALTLWAGVSFAQAAPSVVASRPVLWSVHFDAERLRAGAGRELFASLDPLLTSLSGKNPSVPGGKLESVSICGFQSQKDGGEPYPFLADIGFSAEGGGTAPLFAAISKKRNVPIEEVAGTPAIHFQHEGKEVWIVKFSDRRILLSMSRNLLELVISAGPEGISPETPPKPTEMLGGHIEIESLLAANPALHDSQLLKLLSHVEFHLLSEGGQLDLNAAAVLDSERSARRAARIIDGMVAAISMQDTSGVPWDERLMLKSDGGRLAMQLHLEPQEAKKLFDGIVQGIGSKSFHWETGSKTKASNQDE